MKKKKKEKYLKNSFNNSYASISIRNSYKRTYFSQIN